jgi:hypothetical protein
MTLAITSDDPFPYGSSFYIENLTDEENELSRQRVTESLLSVPSEHLDEYLDKIEEYTLMLADRRPDIGPQLVKTIGKIGDIANGTNASARANGTNASARLLAEVFASPALPLKTVNVRTTTLVKQTWEVNLLVSVVAAAALTYIAVRYGQLEPFKLVDVEALNRDGVDVFQRGLQWAMDNVKHVGENGTPRKMSDFLNVTEIPGLRVTPLDQVKKYLVVNGTAIADHVEIIAGGKLTELTRNVSFSYPVLNEPSKVGYHIVDATNTTFIDFVAELRHVPGSLWWALVKNVVLTAADGLFATGKSFADAQMVSFMSGIKSSGVFAVAMFGFPG